VRIWKNGKIYEGKSFRLAREKRGEAHSGRLFTGNGITEGLRLRAIPSKWNDRVIKPGGRSAAETSPVDPYRRKNRCDSYFPRRLSATDFATVVLIRVIFTHEFLARAAGDRLPRSLASRFLTALIPFCIFSGLIAIS